MKLEELRTTVPAGEEVLAVGMAAHTPVVVTTDRILRTSARGPVWIPFVSVRGCSLAHESHRLVLTLKHDAIDPGSPVGEAGQWWRWLDRCKARRLWRETTLRFSRDDTEALEDFHGLGGERCESVSEDRCGLSSTAPTCEDGSRCQREYLPSGRLVSTIMLM